MKYPDFRYWIILMILSASLPIAAKNAKMEIPSNRYHNYEEMTEVLHQFQESFPQYIKLESAGKSFQGRDIWAVTINNPDTGPEKNKAAMYIHANIHGNEIQGAEVCLYTIWYLMHNYGQIAKITELVNLRVFYILPSVNPDGRAYWFDYPNTSHSSRGGQIPIDNDSDWLYDEDGYDDLDGDGEILQMRKKDPEGRYKIYPDDPRLLLRVKPDEKGEYILLGNEGIDNDGDGRVNEDGPGGYDPNRNWPSDWQPHYVQYGAGDYPLSLPESQAVARFILARPNIAGVQGYHNYGGMILRGPGTEDFGGYPHRDIQVYDLLGEKGEKILPFYRYMVIYKDLYSVHGGFITWTFEDLGIYSFTNELFSSAQYYGKKIDQNVPYWQRYEQQQKQRIEFNDLVEFSDAFVPWKPYTHPTYGEIEIGGWKKFSQRIDPTFILTATCHRNCAFTLFHAQQMPFPVIKAVEIEKLDKALYRIRAGFTNSGIIPTMSARASTHHLHRPDFVTLKGKHVQVLSAGWIHDKYHPVVTPIKGQAEKVVIPDGLWFNETKMIEWVVRGTGKALLVLDCVKGGIVRQEIELK